MSKNVDKMNQESAFKRNADFQKDELGSSLKKIKYKCVPFS